jgi:hypothetical protein
MPASSQAGAVVIKCRTHLTTALGKQQTCNLDGPRIANRVKTHSVSRGRDATRREPTDASWSCRARGDRNADAHFWAASLARSWCGRMGSPVTQDERVTVRDDWQVSRGAENELAGKNVFGVPVRPIPSRRVTAPHVGSATCRRHGSDRPTDRASLSQHATRPSSHVRSGQHVQTQGKVHCIVKPGSLVRADRQRALGITESL